MENYKIPNANDIDPHFGQKVYDIPQDIIAYQQEQINMLQGIYVGQDLERPMDKILDMLTKTCKYIIITPDDWDEDENNLIDVCDVLSCSNCGWEMKFDYDGWFETEPPYNPYFNYCPNCGAKVEGIEYDQ